MLIRQKIIKRADLRAAPAHLFVFGDNLARRGYGGQAKEMRGEPNSIGLPTKRNPDNLYPESFLKDSDLHLIQRVTANDRAKLISHLTNGGTVVWPLSGIGTGLAALRRHAPTIAHFYDLFLIQLEDL